MEISRAESSTQNSGGGGNAGGGNNGGGNAGGNAGGNTGGGGNTGLVSPQYGAVADSFITAILGNPFRPGSLRFIIKEREGADRECDQIREALLRLINSVGGNGPARDEDRNDLELLLAECLIKAGYIPCSIRPESAQLDIQRIKELEALFAEQTNKFNELLDNAPDEIRDEIIGQSIIENRLDRGDSIREYRQAQGDFAVRFDPDDSPAVRAAREQAQALLLTKLELQLARRDLYREHVRGIDSNLVEQKRNSITPSFPGRPRQTNN